MISICIPNYNYEHYLRLTFESLFGQTSQNFEVVLADNQSTDGSVGVMQEYADRFPGQVRYRVNPSNYGFAGNLDQVGGMAQHNFMLMLSSDDVVKPSAIARYQEMIQALPTNEKFILTAAKEVIDSDSKLLSTEGVFAFSKPLWRTTDKDEALSQKMNVGVYKVKATDMLARCFKHMANPFNFLATLYPKALYEEVGGYGATRIINPDKWFHWKLMAAAEYVYFIDEPLFQYRWHTQNQTAQQANSGYLKYLMDEYRSVMETSSVMLEKSELQASTLQSYFIQEDIIRHGIGELAKGRWLKAFRVFHFGWATFPKLMIKKPGAWVLWVSLATGPLSILFWKLIARTKS